MRDDELAARLEQRGWRDAGLDERRRAILEYVETLTRTPARVTRDQVEALRAVGLDDEDILGVCECASYYAYVNRIADGLGVELEPHLRALDPEIEGESAP